MTYSLDDIKVLYIREMVLYLTEKIISSSGVIWAVEKKGLFVLDHFPGIAPRSFVIFSGFNHDKRSLKKENRVTMLCVKEDKTDNRF